MFFGEVQNSKGIGGSGGRGSGGCRCRQLEFWAGWRFRLELTAD